VSNSDAYANVMAETAMRTPYMSDDALHEHLTHWNETVRVAAQAEASARWAETIMPKDER
jgi:hypothetical protein